MIEYSDLSLMNETMLSNNRKLKSIIAKASNSICTFEDVDEYAKQLGETLGRAVDKMVTPSDLDEATLDAIRKLITADADKTKAFCEVVQLDLNQLAEIGLNPVDVAYDNERLDNLIKETSEITEQEQIRNLFLAIVVDYLQSYVDDWVRTNAKAQAGVGLKPVIVRKWVGTFGTHDTRRTDYCNKLAGRYEYGTETKRVYQRHRGCRCTVSYYPTAKAEGRITALSKGEKDVLQVLWNTGTQYGTSRTSKYRHRKQAAAKM